MRLKAIKFKMIKNINFLHFESLPSTNQKLYQLSENNCPSWTVISTDNQSTGRGYANNSWLSEPYKNSTFSFLIHHSLDVEKDLFYFNMWVATEITNYLTKWQLNAQVKWPNDIILNGKKLGGILIESKIMGYKTKFTVVGLGINLNQRKFGELQHATSVVNESAHEKLDVFEFTKELMLHLYSNYHKIENKSFTDILKNYNQNLFRRNQISVFELDNKKINGVIMRVTEQGKLIINLEGMGEKVFGFKEIKLLY